MAVVALFIGLDMSNLSAVRTLPLRTSGFRCWPSTGRWGAGPIGRASIAAADTFLLFARLAAFDIALEASEFGFESVYRSLVYVAR